MSSQVIFTCVGKLLQTLKKNKKNLVVLSLSNKLKTTASGLHCKRIASNSKQFETSRYLLWYVKVNYPDLVLIQGLPFRVRERTV